jgi:hypothetical protein
MLKTGLNDSAGHNSAAERQDGGVRLLHILERHRDHALGVRLTIKRESHTGICKYANLGLEAYFSSQRRPMAFGTFVKCQSHIKYKNSHHRAQSSSPAQSVAHTASGCPAGKGGGLTVLLAYCIYCR